jgi:hypothetical protein
MKISVLEYNLASAGGRQQTMISGFADCFASMGHEVTVYGNFLGGHIPQKERILDYHLAYNLNLDNFELGYPIQRQNPQRMPLKEWSQGDMLLVPHLGYSVLGEYVACPLVCWCISPREDWDSDSVARIWTNSETQKKILEPFMPASVPEPRVIYAPHDYTPFREAAMPWENRKIDVVFSAKYRHSWFGGKSEGAKVLSQEFQEATELSEAGLSVVGLFLVKDPMDVKPLTDSLNFEHYINIPRRLVAGFMAASKVLFHPSPAESASLMLYEGMNAGCYPVVREAGACREQMGPVGMVFKDFEPAKKHILDVLEGHPVQDQIYCGDSIRQGMKFDRSTNIGIIEEELEIIEGLG